MPDKPHRDSAVATAVEDDGLVVLEIFVFQYSERYSADLDMNLNRHPLLHRLLGEDAGRNVLPTIRRNLELIRAGIRLSGGIGDES
ncbi:hypothetical protein MIMGU_mgv1a017271mg [Erythranthe guttata]|uniref:Uncharacterized protein n=1 Tax=Erythranthe guttata TaxID=4155 RepID=A0A022QKB9_ERYGU|nr:hypothetical protein MIMGU_mgv1a017271mg [Erythranthe guttata]